MSNGQQSDNFKGQEDKKSCDPGEKSNIKTTGQKKKTDIVVQNSQSWDIADLVCNISHSGVISDLTWKYGEVPIMHFGDALIKTRM